MIDIKSKMFLTKIHLIFLSIRMIRVVDEILKGSASEYIKYFY